MAIQNKDDWWELVDTHWQNLIEIFGMFLPMYKPAPMTLYTEVSETNPQVAKNAWLDVERCKHERDNEKLRQYLFAAWESAPDNRSIHSIASWGALCDLLSEDWVFQPEEPTPVDEREEHSKGFVDEKDNRE